MPRIRPTTALTSLKPSGNTTTYLTTCKYCRRGVYKGEAYTWQRQPAGYSHDECIAWAAKQAQAAPVEG
ncbi:hypothetical protein GA0074692_0025 [Micromonospora pallida]|uniref:Uncharacterized protein n=1 Tax=Micromonospora pallida TaxID=145854 RepID=A0A1C6RHA0_9ACTN|nr:hypothetical protein [Micromonospora pallida]SCL16419.1 hypothetical protein GA0074692_0025 [Micromonospora pallida]